MTNPPKKAKSRRNPANSTNERSPVYFLSLEVEGVLCFKDRQVLDLSDGNGKPAQWTVILGDNGVGKTTLLRCLAAIESAKKPFTGSEVPLITGSSLNHFLRWQETNELFHSAAKTIHYVVSRTSLPIAINNKIQNALPNIEIELNINAELEIDFNCVPENSWEIFKELIRYGYGANRRMRKSLLSENYTNNSESLFSDEAALINAEEWLLQTDYAARSTLGEMRDRFQKQLDQIIEILKRILPDIEDIRIAPADEQTPHPRAEFLTPYGWVNLSGLGLGYRTMIAWMVDLAVRLFRRYPDSEDPLAEPAIVLVDEIDLHLHPKWQRNIMSFLTERFPNTQFIVTAHSPLVVQAAKDANIVLLRREGDRVIIDNNPEIIDNWRIDQVLTSVFELPTARPANLDPLLNRRKTLLSKSHLSNEDQSEIQELENQIGSLPTAETPDDIKAMDIIRRAAKILENS